MARHLLCLSVGLLVLAPVAASAADPPPAAPAKPPPPAAAPADDARKGDDYRQFFKKPETTDEYWLALQYEIDVGRFDLASGLLHSMLAKPPTEDELIQLENKYGMAAFIGLRNVDWSNDPQVAGQARKDAGQLIDMVRDAVQKKLNDPERITLYVNNLNGDREEHDFALRELYRSGAVVVPYIVAKLQTAPGEERPALLDALRRLGKETEPALFAVLDSDIPALQLDILDVLRRRGAVGAVPFLWRLTSEHQPDDVRRKATRELADFLNVDPTNLPPAPLALTRLAEGYYLHKVPFGNSNAVSVWRWDVDVKKPVRGWPGAETVKQSQAEEYYGTRFAKEALLFDPTYEPAQAALLSLTLDKGAARAGPPPGKETPAARELLETVNPDLVTAVLETAMKDGRATVILPAVRALGGLHDVGANRPSADGRPALVRALSYPDRRVQMAAADALMRIPGQPDAQTAGRIVEVWRRALAAEPAAKAAPKVIVGYFNDDLDNRVADAVRKAGFDPIPVRTGRDVLRRLNAAADVDLVLADEALPDPGLASLLAQIRSDPNYARIALVLTVRPERESAVRDFVEQMPNMSVIPFGLALNATELKQFLQSRLDEAGPPVSDAELKEYAEKAIHHLAEAARTARAGMDVRPAADAVYAALRTGSLSPEGQIDAIHLAARFVSFKSQTELTNVVLDDKRPAKVRAEATAALILHIQEHGLSMTGPQVDSLTALYAKGGDAELKNELALLMGGMHPDARVTGQRLLNFQPPTPGPPPAPPKEPPAPPPKEPPAPPKDAPPKDK